MVTDRTGTGKRLSAGVVWFAPDNLEGHPDTHTFDEIFYIIKGTARFVAGGTEHQVQAGDVVYCPAGTEHTYLTDESPLQDLPVHHRRLGGDGQGGHRGDLELVARRRPLHRLAYGNLSRPLRLSGAGGLRHKQVNPPSTTRMLPVTYAAASLAKNTAAPCSSCGSPARPIGTRSSIFSQRTGSSSRMSSTGGVIM